MPTKKPAGTPTPARLPLYDCHKQVRAALITGIARAAGMLELGPFGDRAVGSEWIEKHKPTSGDSYFVEYDDGYTSCSPAASFDAGYTLV